MLFLALSNLKISFVLNTSLVRKVFLSPVEPQKTEGERHKTVSARPIAKIEAFPFERFVMPPSSCLRSLSFSAREEVIICGELYC